jgi:hypothetical protein
MTAAIARAVTVHRVLIPVNTLGGSERLTAGNIAYDVTAASY